MAEIPLLSHRSRSAPLAWRDGEPISALKFLSDVRALSERLPPVGHVLNVCADRYRFTVGFAACLVGGRATLLPPTHTPEVIRQVAVFAPDAICLTDDARCAIDLPKVYSDADSQAPVTPWEVPAIDARQLAAIVFTSGSTGVPVAHRKTWGRLAACVRRGAERLGLLDGRLHALVGTVPPQHMYGFESTVLLPLQSGNSFAAERPLFPADVAAVLAAAPRPRALISTPVHLRALLATDIELPSVDLIVSATAPLTAEMAAAAERRFHAELVEIYGSTETGQIATRRTAATDRWRLWSGVSLDEGDGPTFARGGHLEQRTALCDVVESVGADEFLLHGRMEDMVNIAGKRSSFAYLNHQLNAVPGVLDGAFFLRAGENPAAAGVARLAAAVVAPSLTASTLTERLRERIDSAFLPRPLIFVERLPRNSTGKLPRQALEALIAEKG